MNEMFSEFTKNTNAEKRDILNKIDDEKVRNIEFELLNILENEENINLKEKILLLLEKEIETGNFKFIEKMFNSNDSFTRNGAIELLKRHKNYNIIRKSLKHNDKDVRKFAVDSLRFDLSNEAIDVLKEVIREEHDINTVMAAIEMAGEAGIKEVAQLIEEKFIRAGNSMLKCACLEALAKIGCGPLHKSVLRKIESEIENPILIYSLLRYITVINKDDGAEMFEKIMDKYPANIYLKEIVDYLKKLDNEIPEKIKYKLIDMVDTIGDSGEKYEIMKLVYCRENEDDAVTKSKEMLKSDDEMIVLAGLEILTKKGSKEDIADIEEVAARFDSDSILEAIGDAVVKLGCSIKES